jgi:hypothetical protein
MNSSGKVPTYGRGLSPLDVEIGCAATMYPSQMGPATARVIVTPQRTAKAQTAAHRSATAPIR